MKKQQELDFFHNVKQNWNEEALFEGHFCNSGFQKGKSPLKILPGGRDGEIIYPHATTWRAMNDLKHRTCKHPHAFSLIQLFQILCKIFKMYKKIIFWWLLFMETFTLVTPDWLDWCHWSKIFSWLSHFSSQCVPTVSCNVSEP